MRRQVPGGYELDDDPARLDLDAIWDFLSTEAYWGTDRSRDVIERQVRDAAQTREAELRELLAQERLRRVEVQGQMRRLTRRVGEMAAAINALNQVRPANGKPVQ